VIAASNLLEKLDPALLRPGRFDRQIFVSPPDVRDRQAILEVHTRDKDVEGVDLELIARQTSGLTGADLANICNEAAIFAARRGAESIAGVDFDHALERVIAGAQSRRVLSDHERTVVAYHEAGHALCGELLPSVDPVHKISIVPRGRALGYTLNLPDEDRYLKTRDELIDYMTMLLGGRAAEQIVFGDVTTGASDDLRRVADIANAMISDYAMGTSGAVIGTDAGARVSDLTLRIRDEERQQLVHESRHAARELIETHREKLDELARELLANEVLERPTIDRIMAGVPRRPSIAAFRRSGGHVGGPQG
jgi:cell division protease FtsH